MDQDRLSRLLLFYAGEIKKQEFAPKEMSAQDYDATELPVVTVMEHLGWMAEKAANEFAFSKNPDEVTKAHRWLGYIQGELRALGVFSITDLREHARKPLGTPWPSPKGPNHPSNY